MNPPSKLTPEAVVVDANVPIAITANEAGEHAATIAINSYLARPAVPFAPGAIVAEVLYVLCGKNVDGCLSDEEHEQAVEDFALFMQFVKSAPAGDGLLVRRAATIRGSLSCRRSADGIYIALAEELAVFYRTTLLTFDENMPKLAARISPTIRIDLLVV